VTEFARILMQCKPPGRGSGFYRSTRRKRKSSKVKEVLANQVSIRPSKHQHYPQLHLHREDTGQRIRYLCCIEEMLTSAQQQLFGEYKDGPQEFIKLSMKWPGGLYVLLIGYPKDGPAERLAIGLIDLGTWNLLNQTTKRIKLG
jgi:hypothetical protein